MNPGPRSASEWGIAGQRTVAGFSVKKFAQPPSRRLPWHEHAAASLCFVVSGSYTERTRSGSSLKQCGPRAMVFKPAGECHSDDFGSAGATCLLIEVEPARLAALAPVANLFAEPRLEHSARLGVLGHRLYGEFGSEDACSALAVEGLILEILAEASRSVVDAGEARPPAWLLKAYELVHASFCESLSLSSVARQVGIHPSHLARSWRRHYRQSIGDSVRKLRIELAAQDLAGTTTSLTEIGLKLGFFDQSHFSRVFTRQTGMTPAQYRQASRR